MNKVGGSYIDRLRGCPRLNRSHPHSFTDECGRSAPDGWLSHGYSRYAGKRLRHVFRDNTLVQRDVKFVAKRLGERLVASRMAIPYLQRAAFGEPRLFSARMKRLSLNQMAEFVLEDAEQSDANNVKRRYWTPSSPVIHLAAAIAIIGQEQHKKGVQSRFEHLLILRELIEEVVRRAQLFEELIAKSERFPIRAAELVRVRIV